MKDLIKLENIDNLEALENITNNDVDYNSSDIVPLNSYTTLLKK